MAASPIESFIRSRRDASREQAFGEFLQTPRIKDWASGDESRVERLRSEFNRAWDRVNGDGDDAQDAVDAAAPAPPASGKTRTVTPTARGKRAPPEPAMEKPSASDAVTGAQDAKWARFGKVTQSVMCPKCGSVRLHAHLDHDAVNIRCRQCDSVYTDLLELIPVRRVGPFAFLFGEGLGGVGTAVGLGAALALVYGVLKWGV